MEKGKLTKMNILVFSWRDPKHPLAGGAEQVVFEHMKGWVAAGYKVTHFSSYYKGGKKIEEIEGITFIRSGLQLLGVQIAGFFWYIFGSHPKFDLVIDEFHGIPFFTPFFVRTEKVAILQEVAREVWLKNDLPFPFNKMIGLIGYTFEPLIYLFYRKIPFMVGSKSAALGLAKMGIPGRNITVVPHGVIVEIPKALPKKEEVKTVVFLGALAKDKGVEDAIDAFSEMSKGGVFNFWIIGRGGGDYVVKLKKKCKELGILGKVKFWGFVSQKTKFDLLARSHIMINPSLLEGWGLVNIEANSFGVPVVAYRSPGLVDSVKDGVSGMICNENTPIEMARLIRKILRDESLYKKLVRGSLRWSKRFKWPKSKKLSLTLLNRVVKLNKR